MPESERWDACLARPISSFHEGCSRLGRGSAGVKFTYSHLSGYFHTVRPFVYRPASDVPSYCISKNVHSQQYRKWMLCCICNNRMEHDIENSGLYIVVKLPYYSVRHVSLLVRASTGQTLQDGMKSAVQIIDNTICMIHDCESGEHEQGSDVAHHAMTDSTAGYFSFTPTSIIFQRYPDVNDGVKYIPS
ncbi:hypothetical protein CRG98_011898 [Punica granatum]|uniref:Uncharacterized protein n=1 Tax=Punica granatum TaxID=22663 RepID=A0A2I0KGQ6_PUNGR|nr:hypothetical protein CRG98_011898 [Punica granatum]